MSRADTAAPSGTGWIIPAGAAVVLLLVGAGGYFLYLHTGAMLQRSQALPPLLILVLALIGGAASFFSPCSIAITPAFLAYLATGNQSGTDARKLSRPLVFAAALVAVGIVAFYAAAGIVIGAVGSVAYNYLVYFLPVVGAAFILLGALMLLGRTGKLAFVERWNPTNRRYARQEVGVFAVGAPKKRTLVSFGFAYGAASHTCSLPIFLGILLVPLVAGNYPLAALSVFAYGFAIAVLVVVMMMLGQRVFTALRSMGPWLIRITAALFIVTVGFLFYYFGLNYGAYLTPASMVATIATSQQYRLIEGAGGSGYPYQPRVLTIPAGHLVQVAVTDHIGGCLLSTIFEGLGPNGRPVEITVPVGETRVVQLFASRPGSYTFHCGGEMYSGTVLAQ